MAERSEAWLQERLDAQKWWDHYLDVLNERDRLREALERIIELDLQRNDFRTSILLTRAKWIAEVALAGPLAGHTRPLREEER